MTIKHEIVPIKIRLYGESFKIHTLAINDADKIDFIKVSERLNESIEEALLNISFFRILNRNKFQSLEDITSHSFGGLINTHKNKIEIWQGRRCLQKFSLNELFYPSTLFPLFNTLSRSLDIKLKNKIFLIEREIGLIGEYILDCNDFDISFLRFNICDVKYVNENFQLLQAIRYKSTKLASQKSDTLITYRYCVNHLKIN